MRSSTRKLRGRLRVLAMAGAAALLLAMALPVWAGEVDGSGSLDEKDGKAMTLVVDDKVLRITDETDIFSGENQRISFAQIPDPSDSLVDVIYEGRSFGDSIVATRIVVRPAPQ